MSRRVRAGTPMTAEVKEQRAEINKKNKEAGITGNYGWGFKNKKARELGLITIDDIDYRAYDWEGDKEGATGEIIKEDDFAPLGQLRIIGGRPIIEWEDKEIFDAHKDIASGKEYYDQVDISELEEEQQEERPTPKESQSTKEEAAPPRQEEEVAPRQETPRLTGRDVELFRDTPKLTRNRERVEGSWRQQERGKCYTRTNKNGGAYVVCEEGSKGQAGVYQPRDHEFGIRANRGDPDQKGRSKTQAIKKNRPVLRKYDDDGKIIEESESQYFIPLGKDGGNVLLYPADKGGFGTTTDLYSGYKTKLGKATIQQLKKNAISIPLNDFNAQYRASRGLNNVGDDQDNMEAGDYELGGSGEHEPTAADYEATGEWGGVVVTAAEKAELEKRKKNLARDKKVVKARRERDKLAKAEKEIFEEVGGRGRAGFREAIVRRGAARRIRQSPAAVQRRKDIGEIREAVRQKRRGYVPSDDAALGAMRRLGYSGRGGDEYEDLDLAIEDMKAGKLMYD